jgi:hypothetical protein
VIAIIQESKQATALMIAKYTCKNKKIYYDGSLINVSCNSIPRNEARAITPIVKKKQKYTVEPTRTRNQKASCYNMIVFEVL